MGGWPGAVSIYSLGWQGREPEGLQWTSRARGLGLGPQAQTLLPGPTRNPCLPSSPQEMIPFAVVGSDHEYQVNGKRILGRKTKWGTIEGNRPACVWDRPTDLHNEAASAPPPPPHPPPPSCPSRPGGGKLPIQELLADRALPTPGSPMGGEASREEG